MIYQNEKTRPGGQPGIRQSQEILYLRAFLGTYVAPTCAFLRERTSNAWQLWHKIGTSLFVTRSQSQGEAA